MIKLITLVGILFCSVSFAQIDIDYSRAGVANPNWRDPVADVSGLPVINNNIGDVRLDYGAGDLYYWDGSNWQALSSGGGGGSVTSVNGQTGVVVLDTDDVAEGASNLYYLDSRARSAFSGSAPLSYNSGSGVFSIAQATNSVDGYLDSADWVTFNSKMSNPMTTQYDLIVGGLSGTPQRLGIGSNLQFLQVVGGAIQWSTVATGITTIEDAVTTTTGFGADEILFSDGSVVRGNSKFTYNPTTNLFQVTDGTDRFLRISSGAKTFCIGDCDGAEPYIESSASGNLLQLVATNLEMGGNQYVYPAVQATAGQFLKADSVALGIATLDWVSLTTSDIPEGSNLYYTDERVDDRVSNLLVAGTGIDLTYNDAGNSLTVAVDGSVTSGLLYQGVWNASTNTPTLPTPASCTTSELYVVGTAGSTTLDGISTWVVGDFLFCSASNTWERVVGTNLTQITRGVTPTTSFTGEEILFVDSGGAVVDGRTTFTYNRATDVFQVLDSSNLSQYLYADYQNNNYSLGDVDFTNLGPSFDMSPTKVNIKGDLFTGGVQGNTFGINFSSGVTVIGDIDGLASSAVATITYALGGENFQFAVAGSPYLNIDPIGGLYEMGDTGGVVNNSYVRVDDTLQRFIVNTDEIVLNGQRYAFPSGAASVSEVLSVSSVAGGLVTLDWVAGGGGFANPMTTNGDLITQAAGVPARIAIGSSGTYLKSNGSAASWQSAMSELNSLTGTSQTLAVGTSGTDFAISSSGTTHTFNLPSASTSARGVVSTGAQVMTGAKGLATSLVVGASTSTPSTGAVLDVNSTSGFLLPPRMTTAQKTAIASGFPTNGSMVFDTDLGVGQFWTGSSWNSFGLAVSSPVSGASTNTILFAGSTGLLGSSGNLKWDNASQSMGINFSAPGGAGLVIVPPTTTDHQLRLTLLASQTGDRIQLRNADNFTQTGRMTVGGLWQLPTGSATTPTYSFEGDANTGFYRTGADAAAVATNGANRLTITNNGVGVTNLIGISGAPTVAAGTGAGTTPTIALSSQTNTSGVLTLTTGTTPAASATVATITFSGTLASAPECQIQGIDPDAAALSGTSAVYVSATTTTTMTISVLSTNLTAATQYIWNYHCMQ